MIQIFGGGAGTLTVDSTELWGTTFTTTWGCWEMAAPSVSE
eukprot:COSAG01_NODE_4742_length_4773_cov_4.259521_3_plen_41_part_00